ncbi:MAG TPA: flagellar basal body rod protein FlgB [Burkholderiales bacterium]|nr:flagellar basal body rod protein FlgB [Burkholderiales bacterium]
MLTGLDSYLSGPLNALNVRAARSEVLASNIANADTPNYKARDMDFASVLRGAMGGGSKLELVRTSVKHLSPVQGSAGAGNLLYRIPMQPSIDGNTVELDTELAQFSDNALRTQADLTFLSHRLRSLQMAIAGQ